VGVQVGRRKTQLVTAFRAMFDPSLDTVRPAQHASGEINLSAREQLTNPARTDSLAAQPDLGHFAGNKTKLTSQPAQ
jgi:hypothetical protein